ncbi:MAG: tetratricopeptide repeat protein [Planctomycetota bacterium]|jgi:tetratricopeptide (TPR) repeat protein
MRFTVLATITLLTVALSTSSFAGDSGASRELEKGFYKEQADRDLEGAIRIYSELVEKHVSERAIAAKALVRMGICLEKLGKKKKAIEALERVVAEFNDQRREADEARKTLLKIASSSRAETPAAGGRASEKEADSGAREAERIRRVLKSETISMDFRDAGLRDIVDFLRNTKGINMIADPKVLENFEAEGRTINLQVQDLNFGDGINILMRFNNLEWAILHHVLYISEAEFLAQYKSMGWFGDPMSKHPESRLEGRRIRFDYSGKTLGEAVRAMGRLLGQTMNISSSAEKSLEENVGNFKGDSVDPSTALEQLLAPHGLGYAARPEGVWIATDRELDAYRTRRRRTLVGPHTEADRALLEVLRRKLVSLDFLDTPLEAVVAFLSEVSGLNMLIGPSVAGSGRSSEITVELKVEEIPLEQALRLLLMSHELEYRIEHGVLTVERREVNIEVAEKPPLELLREALDSCIDVDFRETPIEQVLVFLSAASGAPIVADPRVRAMMKKGLGSVTLRMQGTSMRKVLEASLKPLHLDFDFLHGVIYVNWAGLLPKDLALKWFGDQPGLHISGSELIILQALRSKKVSMTLEGAEVSTLLDLLSRKARIEIALSPLAAATVETKKMQFQAGNITAENALRLILTPHSLDYRIEDTVIKVDVRKKK